MENLYKQHHDTVSYLNDLYIQKNKRYGNSFDISLDTFGLIAGVVRIGDKYNRLTTLTKGELTELDESLKDTLLDMANYCIMSAMWLERKKADTLNE